MKKHASILVSVLCLGIILLNGCLFKSKYYSGYERSKEFGLFSWKSNIFYDAQLRNDCIEQAKIREIYQYFSDESLKNGEAKHFIVEMEKKEISVYALIGQPEWAYEKESIDLMTEIKKFSHMNLSGIMVDIEPYLLDEWDGSAEEQEKLMKSYLKAIEKVYNFSKDLNWKCIVCIPNFYDVSCPNILRQLVKQYCDGIAVMNYNRKDEIGQIENEVNYVKKYGKRIICIYELQEVGKHELKEINTYAEQGLTALWESSKHLSNNFQYDNLYFAYHYYEPLIKMLQKR